MRWGGDQRGVAINSLGPRRPSLAGVGKEEGCDCNLIFIAIHIPK